jgi:hypothetical protein
MGTLMVGGGTAATYLPLSTPSHLATKCQHARSLRCDVRDADTSDMRDADITDVECVSHPPYDATIFFCARHVTCGAWCTGRATCYAAPGVGCVARLCAGHAPTGPRRPAGTQWWHRRRFRFRSAVGDREGTSGASAHRPRRCSRESASNWVALLPWLGCLVVRLLGC